MTELQILCAVKDHNEHIDCTELLNLDDDDPNHYPLANRDLIRLLIEQDILYGIPKPGNSITFGKLGRIRWQNLMVEEHYKQETQKHAEEERERLIAELANEKAERKAEKQRDRKFEILLMLLSALLANLDRVFPLLKRLCLWVASLF